MSTASDVCPSTSSGRWRRSFAAGLTVLALSLTACGEVETESTDSYHPATVESVDPTSPPQVKLTEEAAKRIDLVLTTVDREDGELVVDYEALVYDPKGAAWLYELKGPLTFVRVAVEVEKIDEDDVVLAKGPHPGTQVAAQGVTEIYGAELGMEGSH
jgi:hypothetical protein